MIFESDVLTATLIDHKIVEVISLPHVEVDAMHLQQMYSELRVTEPPIGLVLHEIHPHSYTYEAILYMQHFEHIKVVSAVTQRCLSRSSMSFIQVLHPELNLKIFDDLKSACDWVGVQLRS